MKQVGMRRLDKYDFISYIDTPRLFWNQFPYKVVVNMAQRRAKRHGAAADTSWQLDNETIRNRGAYKARLLALAPANRATWRSIDTTHSLSFFFQTFDDTDHFVDHAKTRVIEVHRPFSQHHLDMMTEDAKVVVRPTLFWRRYSWCVIFRQFYGDTLLQEDELLRWYRRCFGNPKRIDEKRSFFSYGTVHRLYLRDERDVLFSKLANSGLIRRIEHAVLASHLDQNNENQSCKDTD